LKNSCQRIYPIALSVFLGLQILVIVDVFHERKLNFAVFGILIGLCGANLSSTSNGNLKISSWWVVIAFLFAVLLRAIPYFDNSVPLGYDAGLYKFAFETPFGEAWLKQIYPLLFLRVMSAITNLTSINFVLIPLFIIFSASTCVILYFVIKKVFDKNIGILAALLFSFSISQFHVFSNLFYKNSLGIIFLLLTFTYYDRSKTIQPGLIAVGCLLGGIHRPAFLIFGISFLVFIAINIQSYRRKEILNAIINGLVILILVMIINYDRIDEFFLERIRIAFDTTGKVGDQGGFYITLWEYLNHSALLIAFAIPGISLVRKKQLPLTITFIVLLTIIVGKLYFHRRYIIYLDLILIIFSSYGLLSLVNSKIFPKDYLGKIMMILVLCIAGAKITKTSFNLDPLINEIELESISDLNYSLEQDASLLLTDAYYAPWFKGWLKREIIVPGIFETDILTYAQWNLLWYGDQEDKEGILDLFPSPTYVHVGMRTTGLTPFTGQCFKKMAVKEMNLFQYNCK